MARHFTACHDPALKARVTRRLAMVYDDGPSATADRPPYVRAASGLSTFREHLAVVQDDANWLALIDMEDRIRALPLPPGPSGARVFSSKRGNRREKFDLEACITVPGQDGPELVGFASGSRPGREWILRVREKAADGTALAATTSHEQLEADLDAEFLNAARFYEGLRANLAFCGAGRT